MDDSGIVRHIEGLGDLSGDRKRLLDGHRAFLKALCKRRAFDQLQHERTQAVAFLDPVDCPDVGVIERRQHARLTLEPGAPLRVCQHSLGQHLDGDLAPQLFVTCPIHHAHPSGPEERENGVAAQAAANELVRGIHLREPVPAWVLSYRRCG